MIFEIIGIIAITLVLGYFFLVFFVYGLFCWGGFDEYDPKAGTVLWLIAAAIGVAWWFAAGQFINLSVNIG